MADPTDQDCRDWAAWHDKMPGKEPTLFVTGTCSVPTTGYSCDLSEDADEPAVGTTLVLRRTLTEPPVGHDTLSEVTCRFERVTDATYTHVRILPDDVEIEVQEVS